MRLHPRGVLFFAYDMARARLATEIQQVAPWDEKYCGAVGMLAMDILGLEGR